MCTATCSKDSDAYCKTIEYDYDDDNVSFIFKIQYGIFTCLFE